MNSVLTLLIAILIIPIISLPSEAHTAFDKKKLKDFNSWTSCKKDKYANNSKELTCLFPKNRQDHTDSIRVLCEEKVLAPIWENQWRQNYGETKFSELPPEALKKFPIYTVLMYTSHDIRALDIEELLDSMGTTAPRISYNDSKSPWAKECKKIFNEPKMNNNFSEDRRNKDKSRNENSHQIYLKAADYKGCMNYQNR